MTQQVLALKWRPRTFSEVIGQPHVVQALSNGLDNNRLHHAFLFTGTRGVGKTTLARIFAKSLNCEKGVTSTPCGVCSICREVDEGRFVDLIEIDAASRTRVEDTREILDNVQYAPTRGRYKIYLIDEVHMLSNSSFNALLKTLEEPPSHVKFLLATTDPQKLPVTVLSRCLRFQLKRIQDQDIAGQLDKILTAENIPFEDEALKLIAKAGDGSMRDALSLLDQAIAYGGQQVLYTATHEMLGLIDTQYLTRILEALATKESGQVIKTLHELKANGLDYYRFLEDLIDAFHLLTMIQLSPEFASTESDDLVRIASLFSAEDLQLFYQVALNGRKDLQNHPNSEVGFEMTLLRMVLFAPHAPIGVEDQKKNLLTPENHNNSIVSQSNALDSVPTESGVEVVLAPQPEETRKSDISALSDTVESRDADKHEQRRPEVDLPWVIEIPVTTQNTVFKDTDSAPHINAYNHDEKNSGDNLHVDSSEKETVMGDDAISPLSFNIDEELAVESSSGDSRDDMQNRVELYPNEASDLSVGNIQEVHHDNSSNGMGYIVEASGYGQPAGDRADIIEVTDTSLLNNDIDVPQNEVLITLADLNNNEAWLTLVSSLSLESVLSGIAHSLVFKSFDGKNLILERPISVQAFRVDEAEVRLAMAISHKLKADIVCKIEYVEQLDVENLHERTERLDEERLQKALDNFRQDPVVQYLQNELQAVLLDKTLKPID